MHRLTLAAGLFLFGLGACDSEPARNAAAGASGENKVAAPAPAPAPAIVLEGAGLRIPGASPPRTLGFDLAEADTVEALTGALGRPPTERGENSECGGGGMKFALWKNELTAWFLDGRFAGWDSRGRLHTLDGVGVGSGRAEVSTLPGFEVEESSLGTEFRARGLSGILSSGAPDSEVTHLWGGATCVFR